VQVEAVGIPSITPEQLQNSSLFDGFPFSKGQEVINARAAMAGFVAAVVSEVATQKSVWVQIAGRCVARLVVGPNKSRTGDLYNVLHSN
jgi:hypothetical protein